VAPAGRPFKDFETSRGKRRNDVSQRASFHLLWPLQRRKYGITGRRQISSEPDHNVCLETRFFLKQITRILSFSKSRCDRLLDFLLQSIVRVKDDVRESV